MAKALRDIPLLMGKAYKTGDTIPAAVVSKMTAQVIRAMVNNHVIEVEGIDPGNGAGVGQHLTARLDKQGEQIKKLEAGRAEDAKVISALGLRLDALEKKSTKVAKAAAKAK